MIHRPNIAILYIALATINLPITCAAQEVDSLESNIPIVLTPTRLRQSLADVPASVTIITGEMMNRFGIQSLPDALRLVPGMAVTQVNGNDFRINYHGTNILVPRRMNVLVDGISIYRPAFARVDWKEFPVSIEDIDKIEVTRGPNSVSYGANSMLAIINIITKHPSAVEGSTLSVTGGSLNTAASLMRYSGKSGDSTTYRVTVEHQNDNGFDYASTKGVGHDSTRLNKLNFRSITDIGYNETLDLQAAVVQGMKESEFIDRYQLTFPDVHLREYYLGAQWNKSLAQNHELKIQAYASDHQSDQPWTTCLPTALLLPQMFTLWRSNPNYANTLLAGRIPKGGTAQDDALAASARAAIVALGARAAKPTCVDANQNYVERRVDVELQDTYVISEVLRMVNGVGFRQDMGDGQTYLGGKFTNDSLRAFSNIEYKPSKSIGINAGGFLEKDSITGVSVSPRLALNSHLDENHTIRFVVSKATRMPDIEEQHANWTYRTTNYSTPLNGSREGIFFQSARSPGNLTGEKILSKEIGYLGNFPKYGILLDAKVFEDQLTDLISEKLQLTNYAPSNNNSARLRGAEMQITYEPSDRWMMHVAYAYLENDASTILEQTQYARNSGALGITHVLDNDWRCSLAFYQYGATTAGQTFYGREDLTLSKTFRFGKDKNIIPSFTISHLDARSSTYLVDAGQIRESRYNDAIQYSMTLKIMF